MNTLFEKEKFKIQQILNSTILSLCNNGLTFNEEMNIEGLIGITLDKNNIILVKIDQVNSSKKKYIKAESSQDQTPKKGSKHYQEIIDLDSQCINESQDILTSNNSHVHGMANIKTEWHSFGDFENFQQIENTNEDYGEESQDYSEYEQGDYIEEGTNYFDAEQQDNINCSYQQPGEFDSYSDIVHTNGGSFNGFKRASSISGSDFIKSEVPVNKQVKLEQDELECNFKPSIIKQKNKTPKKQFAKKFPATNINGQSIEIKNEPTFLKPASFNQQQQTFCNQPAPFKAQEQTYPPQNLGSFNQQNESALNPRVKICQNKMIPRSKSNQVDGAMLLRATQMVREGKMTAKDAVSLFGIPRSTFYRKLSDMRKKCGEQDTETYQGWDEQQDDHGDDVAHLS